MKSLRVIREYLEEKVPSLIELKPLNYTDFFLEVKDLVASNKYLGDISKLTNEGEDETLYLKPLDSFIKYEYLNGNLRGVYLIHPALENTEDIYPDGLNTKGRKDILDYLKEKVTEDIFIGSLIDDYDDFLEKIEDEEYDWFVLIIMDTWEWADDYNLSISKVGEELEIVKGDVKARLTLYFEELNTLVSLVGWSTSSWDTDWDNGVYYLSRPSTQLTTTYVEDKR
jgi:hypothetical protein